MFDASARAHEGEAREGAERVLLARKLGLEAPHLAAALGCAIGLVVAGPGVVHGDGSARREDPNSVLEVAPRLLVRVVAVDEDQVRRRAVVALEELVGAHLPEAR